MRACMATSPKPRFSGTGAEGGGVGTSPVVLARLATTRTRRDQQGEANDEYGQAAKFVVVFASPHCLRNCPCPKYRP
ncbi:hypothetical protein S1361_00625 [Streptomyces cyanogenus]|uniref:Uncharacterized protein n=1 Tax=Streptomyces cyanogenus TaxID=80860 RepID=A0ABX7TJQ4_STRCY|nr:hypothetical protein S1361_00625 [Streptomyces cyanogenus]